MNVVIVGCGRVGALLAANLDKGGHQVTIIDTSTLAFDRLPDETWVYPGHGDDTTLGAERPHLKEWAERGW